MWIADEKWLTAAELRRALEQVPAGYVVQPNAVGNLRIYDGVEYAGWIDFEDGEMILFERPGVQP